MYSKVNKLYIYMYPLFEIPYILIMVVTQLYMFVRIQRMVHLIKGDSPYVN